MDYIDDNDKDGDFEGCHPKPSTRKQGDSVSIADVAPSSHTNRALLSPGARSPLEEIKDPFVRSLTNRHSLTQLHEWLKSIKSSVSNSVSATMITSQHLDLQPICQLTVIELSFKSIELNPSPLRKFQTLEDQEILSSTVSALQVCVLTATSANPSITLPATQGSNYYFNRRLHG